MGQSVRSLLAELTEAASRVRDAPAKKLMPRENRVGEDGHESMLLPKPSKFRGWGQELDRGRNPRRLAERSAGDVEGRPLGEPNLSRDEETEENLHEEPKEHGSGKLAHRHLPVWVRKHQRRWRGEVPADGSGGTVGKGHW